MSEDDIEVVRYRGLVDPVFFCQFFLDEWFYAPIDWLHRGLLAILRHQTDFLLNFGLEVWGEIEFEWTPEKLAKIEKYFTWKENPDDPDSPSHQIFQLERDEQGLPIKVDLFLSEKLLLILPRGIGKTTIVNAANLMGIVYKDEEFLVYLSEAATHAEQQLANIKRQLESNERLIIAYGNLVPERSSGQKWRDDLIETTSGVVVTARGRMGQVRGLNHMGHRPTKIVIDDVEDKDSVKTEEQRLKTRIWLKADVEPALPRIGGKRGSLVALGTILNTEALVVNISKDPTWVTVKFGAIGPDGEPIAPYYMTLDQFEKEKQSYARNGLLPVFYMEYASETRFEDESRTFRLEDIKFQILERTAFAGVSQALDPAISESRRADYSAIAVVGMTDKGRIHVLDMWMEKGAHPGILISEFFRLHYKWTPTKHGIEAVAYQTSLIHFMQEEMFRQAKKWGTKAYFEIEPIRHNTQLSKERRVEGMLATRYRAGYISHQQRFPILETQLADWPSGKKDGPDAVAMAVTLLDPYAGYAFENDEDGIDRLAANQFPPLEDVIGGDWRSSP